ncbi:hypothetical protein MUP65_00925 [Patescibacteria group bacterium]|nr:hypothetical protein [Patescibacteria group bacterium]
MSEEKSKSEKLALKIKTSDSHQTAIWLNGKKYSAKQGRSNQVLLPLIVKALKKAGKDWADLSEIEVDPGPGSFTGLRVGFAVANTLGWALKIPVNGKLGPAQPNYEEKK